MYRYNTIQYKVEAGLMKPFYVCYLRIAARKIGKSNVE